jgi:hypothetical protein
VKKTGYVLLLFVLLGLLLAAAGPVFAQGTPTGFKNVKLWVYPEFDDPRLLVMLEGQIEGAAPPATVRFLVPTTAEMYSAGSMDAQRKYTGGPPRRGASTVPGWDEISYEVTTDTFRVEYYDSSIVGQPDKSIYYDFLWLYSIADLTAIVQVPKGSTDFNVTPPGTASLDAAGYTIYTSNFSGLNPGDPPLHFDISYRKADTAPSQSPPAQTGGGSSTVLLIVIAGIAAVIAVGGFLWFRRPQPANRAARRQIARNAPGRRAASSQPGQPSRFCTQCGQRLEGSPKFCPNCGKKLM